MNRGQVIFWMTEGGEVSPEAFAAIDGRPRLPPFVSALAYELARLPAPKGEQPAPARALFRQGSIQSRIYDRMKSLGTEVTITPEEAQAFLADPEVSRKNVMQSLADLVSRGLARASGPTRGRRYRYRSPEEPAEQAGAEDEEEEDL